MRDLFYGISNGLQNQSGFVPIQVTAPLEQPPRRMRGKLCQQVHIARSAAKIVVLRMYVYPAHGCPLPCDFDPVKAGCSRPCPVTRRYI